MYGHFAFMQGFVFVFIQTPSYSPCARTMSMSPSRCQGALCTDCPSSALPTAVKPLFLLI